jgi:hypothetical protein
MSHYSEINQPKTGIPSMNYSSRESSNLPKPFIPFNTNSLQIKHLQKPKNNKESKKNRTVAIRDARRIKESGYN